MTRYVVEPANWVGGGFTGADRIEMLRNALADLQNIVNDFEETHQGQIRIIDGLWINTMLLIEAEPAVARELATVRGIGKVREETPPANIKDLIDNNKKNRGPAI